MNEHNTEILFDYLEGIVQRLDEIRDRLPPLPLVAPPQWPKNGQCMFCGGSHPAGMQCPNLNPTCVATAKEGRE